VKGRSVTLKLKRRKEGAPEPYKFLGKSSTQCHHNRHGMQMSA
jgi:hypothetical protein